jgi:aminodeoxyfutalosine synthase
MEALIKNAGLENIYYKVKMGERLLKEDGIKLYQSPLLAIGYLANIVREKLHGKRTYYVYNQHINYSNVCINLCKFCAFGRPKKDPKAFTFSLKDIEEKLENRMEEPIHEVHIVGGLHPDLPFDYYLKILRLVYKLRPKACIKAYTAVEIAHFSKITGKGVEEILEILKEAGLTALPGGGAEVFSPRVRKLICPKKISGKKWLEISKIAHTLGIRTNATLLYGHLETIEERIEHLLALREAQDETGGFICFIPLSFHPKNTRLSYLPGPTGIDDLKTVAISRLILDNIPHIKAYWIMLTPKLAQISLNFGADDLDGTIIEEKITHMAGAMSEQSLTRSELKSLIKEAGYEPTERDTLFRKINA